MRYQKKLRSLLLQKEIECSCGAYFRNDFVAFNNLNKADREIRSGHWNREGNRGHELDGKTVGIIGYGNMEMLCKKLRGFEVEVLCYDIKEHVGDANAKQVSLKELQQKSRCAELVFLGHRKLIKWLMRPL
jgi:hypothetical protein